MPPVTIIPIKPADLHQYWPFLERGLNDIVRKVKPDWIPPDVYSALRAGSATVAIACRGDHQLGFVIYYRQERSWCNKADLFVWCMWNIPLRERLPDDDMPDAMKTGIDYLHDWQRAWGCERVISITTADDRGHALAARYGKGLLALTYEI